MKLFVPSCVPKLHSHSVRTSRACGPGRLTAIWVLCRRLPILTPLRIILSTAICLHPTVAITIPNNTAPVGSPCGRPKAGARRTSGCSAHRRRRCNAQRGRAPAPAPAAPRRRRGPPVRPTAAVARRRPNAAPPSPHEILGKIVKQPVTSLNSADTP